MTKLKDLKKEHKKLEGITKKATKKRLNDRTSDSWMNLRELKKLKLKLKDKINQLKRQLSLRQSNICNRYVITKPVNKTRRMVENVVEATNKDNYNAHPHKNYQCLKTIQMTKLYKLYSGSKQLLGFRNEI